MRTAHSITDSTSIKAGYRLLCSLFAAYDFPVFYRDDDPDPLDAFLQYSDEDMSENLITLAAIARACDDELGALTKIEPNFPKGVGKLIHEGEKSKPLTIREACNKIIHAKVVEYDLAWSEENPIWYEWFKAQEQEVKNQYKTPALKLEGAHQNGKKWVARVELIPFILATSMWDMWKWKLA
ncbi:MAG TPA: hypothetical protein VFF74_05725 [Methylophilaceae bacterium]|nr:hypothetical protein [Methylophilaceae bacterium]